MVLSLDPVLVADVHGLLVVFDGLVGGLVADEAPWFHGLLRSVFSHFSSHSW